MMQSGPFSARPMARFRLGLGGALAISMILHLVLLGWLHYGGAAGLLLVPVTRGTLVPTASPVPGNPTALNFTFVDVPEDRAVAENPQARLLSDKTRMARQPVPTPPDAKNLGPDPHAEGNSRIRQLARPGPPVPVAPSPPPPSSAAPSGSGGGSTGRSGPVARDEEGWEKVLPGEEGATPGPSGEGDGGEGSASERREAFKDALKRLEAGTYDFSSFDNPSYRSGSNYGTLSFDTKGFDWGDYARQLYLIIKKNWYDRIPIAAYYGQKGKVFIRFVIEKDGSITDLAVLRTCDVAPFNRAAENAIRASHPLPPLPANFPKEREGVTFGFYYNLPIDEP